MANSLYRSEVDCTTKLDWTRLLTQFEDANIYQTWSYGAIRWGEKKLSHLVLRKGGEVVAMAQLRIMRLPILSCGVAHMRWGPLCQAKGREIDTETLGHIARALHDEYIRKRRLYLRILPNTFVGTRRASVFQQAFWGVCDHRREGCRVERTFILDLAPGLEELRKRLDQKWRNQLNRAERNLLRIVSGETAEEYALFTKIYKEMWNRKRFETTVDVDEFARIQADLTGCERMRVSICFQGSQPAAGIVCSALGSSAVYLLGATSDNGLKAKGAYLLQWEMIKWLKGNGYRYYDLGGIDPERNPGVFHFKSGLSGEEMVRIPALEGCQSRLSKLLNQAADISGNGGWRRIKNWCKKKPELCAMRGRAIEGKI